MDCYCQICINFTNMPDMIGQVGVVVLARDHLPITRGILDSLAEDSPGFFNLSIGYRTGISFVTTGIVFQITIYLLSITISPFLSNIYIYIYVYNICL